MNQARVRVLRSERSGYAWRDHAPGEQNVCGSASPQRLEDGVLDFLSGLDPADVYAITDTVSAGVQYVTVYYRKRRESVEDAAF